MKAGLFAKLRHSLLYLGAVFAISVAGYLIYGWNLMDSVYMVVITMFGVGFGEVHPLETAAGKIFTMVVIVGGTSAVVYVIGQGISRHAILCGYGRIGQILAHELNSSGYPFVVVDLDDTRLALAEESGYLFVKGSATEEETLIRAGIERAEVLATVLPQDTLNVFITLTARNLNRQIRIIARGEQPSTEKKLRQAGADEVVLPAAIGGTRIAHSITRPLTTKFVSDPRGMLGEELKPLGVEIDELRLHPHSNLIGNTVGQLQAASEGHLLVLAVQRADGNVLRSGFLEETLKEGDSLVIIGRTNALPPALRGEVDRESLT